LPRLDIREFRLALERGGYSIGQGAIAPTNVKQPNHELLRAGERNPDISG